VSMLSVGYGKQSRGGCESTVCSRCIGETWGEEVVERGLKSETSGGFTG
jgi:hypothetical protein